MAATSTIQEFINSDKGSNEITHYNFSILNKIVDGDDTIEYTDVDLLDDYMEEIQDKSFRVKLSEEEQLKYFYNPGLLAYDIYGSVEYEFILLKLNGILDPKDFDLEVIRIIDKDSLDTILADIFNAEKQFISYNRGEIDSMMA